VVKRANYTQQQKIVPKHKKGLEGKTEHTSQNKTTKKF
jgi:hypothetical protein